MARRRRRPPADDYQRANSALPGTVADIADDAHPGQAMLGIRVEGQMFLARLTRRSVHTLGLAVGSPVWLQVKSAALLL